MSALSASDEPTDTVSPDPMSLAEHRARELLEDGDVRRAREVIEEAIRLCRTRSDLLWVLADVEFADGDEQAGMRCLAEAVTASGADAAAIGRQIRVLSDNRLWREDLTAIEHIPDQVRDDPAVRTAVGDFYKARGCRGHAVRGYGNRSGLSFPARVNRRLSWLCSGGPFTFVRSRIDAWENSEILPVLRKGRRTFGQLDAVPDLDNCEAQRLKVRIENAYYEWSYRYKLWSAIFRWQLRLLPAAFLPTWLVLFAIVKIAAFISGPPGTAGGSAISAGVALWLPVLLVRSQVRGDLSLRGSLRPTTAWFVFLCALAVLSEIAVAEGYERHVLPVVGWWSWVVFGLAVLPAVSACMLVSAAILIVLASRWILSAQRENCQVVLLDIFLGMFIDLQSRSRQLDLADRLQWSWALEWAARRVSRDLLPSLWLSRLASGDWLRRRAAGWAEALRYMQRELIAQVPGGQPTLKAKLWHEIQCLATGDLGALAWRQPPPTPSRRAMLTRKTIEVLRTVLVAGLPLGAVLASQPLVHFSGAVFRWASIATGVWALLYVVISLDPAIRDKIDTARSLADTLHEARRIG
jgi:hypothetical protein